MVDRLRIEGLLVRDIPTIESLCCALEQGTLSSLSTGKTQNDR